VASGDGTVISGRQVTDAAGVAEVGAWFLGATPGVNTLTANAPGLTAVTFTATATPGQPATMVANSQSVQAGTAGALVADPPSVQIRDMAGNPVPGIPVTFTVTAGGGTVTGLGGDVPATTIMVNTNSLGVATLVSWRLGTLMDINRVVASASGVPNVTFTATAAAGPAASVTVTGGTNNVAVQGTAVQNRPAVRVADVNGNPVVGALVIFAVTDGGGSVSGATQETDATGAARVGSWILGPGAPNTLRATVTNAAGDPLDITGSPVTFSAQAATHIEVANVPATAVRGVNFNITARLVDAVGAPVSLSGVPLTLQIASGGGTLNGVATVTTTASGMATFTVNVTGDAGPRTFTITSPGLIEATTGTITFN
jgi:adhesin/invasin